jgi:exopolysaccharide production protein ExoQ
MNERRTFLELLVLGGCAFVLTRALLSLILLPGDVLTEGNPVWRLILAVSYVSVAMILVPCYRETLFVARRNWFLLTLVILALVSSSWAAMPAQVLQRSIAVLGTTLLGLAFAVLLSLEEQLRLLSWVFRIIAVLSLACVLFLPGTGVSDVGEWKGIFSYKNGLGSIMALSFLVEWHLPAHSYFSKIVNRLAILLSGVLLVFSSSITPLVGVVGALLFIEIYKLAVHRFQIRRYAIVLGMMLIIASGVAMLHMDSAGLVGALGRSSDLTGRAAIWSMVLSVIPQRPMLGYGYAGFWNGATPESLLVDWAMGSVIMYSHNGYLEILLTLGAVGLLLSLGFLWTGIKRAYSCSERSSSSVDLWPLAFLFFFLLHNLAECTILMQDLEWAVCVATIVGADAALLDSATEQEEGLAFVPGEMTT